LRPTETTGVDPQATASFGQLEEIILYIGAFVAAKKKIILP
jgi:hypothetical protein